MKTVGQILSEKRTELKLTLAEIEKETKIRRKYLEAIEKDEFSVVEDGTTLKGFIRNYTKALGLSPENLLAVFRRDYPEKFENDIIPKKIVETVDNEKKIRWTPKLTFFLTIFIIVSSVTFFLVREYINFSSPPPLWVYSPKEKERVKGAIIVSGKTDKDASVKIDNINISVLRDGTFKEEIILPKGENIVTIEVSNRQGKKNTINRQIMVE